MENSAEPHIYKYCVDALTNDGREKSLRGILASVPQITQVDVNRSKRLIRIIAQAPLDLPALTDRLTLQGFHLRDVLKTDNGAAPPVVCETTVTGEMVCYVKGMTCRSCELTIERAWKKVGGVQRIAVQAHSGKARLVCAGASPKQEELQKALGDTSYVVFTDETAFRDACARDRRPSIAEIVGLFALVLLIGTIFLKLGVLKTGVTIGSGMSLGAIFLLGLVAAVSSCIAVTGGVLLSAAAKYNERHPSARPSARMRPVILFVAGRIVGYGLFGGLLGAVGGALAPSSTVTAIFMIVAAAYMTIMGLEMLHIAPAWLKRLMPRMPKSLARRIMNAEGKEHPATPFVLGGATFFLPCGFTQALQLYALTTGSFTAGALALFAFALGTAPSLLALGFASSALKGGFGRFFYKFSGALVVVLGVWNFQNGLALAGYPLRLPEFSAPSTTTTVATETSGTLAGDVQVINMTAGYDGYVPGNFVLRVGKPVRWIIDATDASGCERALVSRKLGIQKYLKPGLNTIEFTPTQPGEVGFSCSMGMYRGSFTVLPSA
ncbi:MAG: sulfite exporter TauE/SafE family protein [Patescibacteria group bacterium]